MNAIITENEPVAIRAWAEKRFIYVELTDGRIFGFQADRFRILGQASEDELKEVGVEVKGHALRWDELDEDLTVAAVVAGRFSLLCPDRWRWHARWRPLIGPVAQLLRGSLAQSHPLILQRSTQPRRVDCWRRFSSTEPIRTSWSVVPRSLLGNRSSWACQISSAWILSRPSDCWNESERRLARFVPKSGQWWPRSSCGSRRTWIV